GGGFMPVLVGSGGAAETHAPKSRIAGIGPGNEDLSGLDGFGPRVRLGYGARSWDGSQTEETAAGGIGLIGLIDARQVRPIGGAEVGAALQDEIRGTARPADDDLGIGARDVQPVLGGACA